MSRLLELQLKKEALQKKIDEIENQLEQIYHEIDKELEI